MAATTKNADPELSRSPRMSTVMDLLRKNPKLSVGTVQERLGLNRNVAQCLLWRAKQRLAVTGVAGNTRVVSGPPPKASKTFRGDEMDFEGLAENSIHNERELIAMADVDTEVWEVKEWTCNVWQMGAAQKAHSVQMHTEKGTPYIAWERDEETKIIRAPLWQVKAKFVRRVQYQRVKAEIDDLKKLADNYAPIYKPFHRKAEDRTGNLLELCIPDLHLGKFAYGRETGHADYDSEIARKLFRRALEGIISRTCGYRFEQIVFVIGNDFFNADNRQLNTTRGTPQGGSTDTRYHRLFRLGKELMIESIDRLTQLADVHVVSVPGNHDEHISYHLADSLLSWYRNNENVTIDTEEKPRKVFEWGECLLEWTHGHNMPPSRLASDLPAEYPLSWGRTKFREIHCGHFHKRSTEEFPGVTVRFLPALCPPDEWHSSMGYVGNLRSADGIIWNKNNGIIGTAVYTEKDALQALQVAA